MLPKKLFGETKFAHTSSATTAHPHSLSWYISRSVIGGLVIATIATRDATPFAVVFHWLADVLRFIHAVLVWIPEHDYLEKISSSIDTFADNL